MNHELWMRWESQAARADAKTEAHDVDLSNAPIECESPIERRLAVFLIPVAEQWGFKVVPQFELGGYRYDFAITNGDVVGLVECDGAEFHSTPEQIARDAAKDLLAKQSRCLMFRYSGSAIHRNARRCAEQIIFQLWRRP